MDDLDFTWGSCCSGSEGVHYVVEACGQPVAEIDLPVTFQHAFSCESNKAKRSWIADVLCKGKIFNSDLHETLLILQKLAASLKISRTWAVK